MCVCIIIVYYLLLCVCVCGCLFIVCIYWLLCVLLCIIQLVQLSISGVTIILLCGLVANNEPIFVAGCVCGS